MSRHPAEAGITLFLLESCYQTILKAAGICRAMSTETRRLPDRLGWDNLATDALELARLMPPGPERNEALKLASQLRCTADARGLIFAKRGRPRK
jgi:hypothetical protein